jgi:type IV pilus assembly protein PilW
MDDFSTCRAHTGTTLVELMIALTIGAFVIATALAMYAHARSVYRTNERIARLQEQARFALSAMEPDIEMAGYFGFTNAAERVRLVSGGQGDVVRATPDGMRQFPSHPGGSPPAAAPALPPGAHACGVNFAVDVSMPVQGSNDVFAMGRDRGASCNPYQGRAQPGADTLTLRRVETRTSAAESDRIQLYASRLSGDALVFADGRAPGPLDADHRIHTMLVRTYYIARDSVGQRDFPALRVKSLTRSGAQAVFADDEVMQGVEDLQVQFGVDTGDHDNDGAVDDASRGDGDGVPKGTGRATRYVDPDHPDLPWQQVVSVRLWLRIRSDEPETGFADTRTYRYANVEYTPAGADRRYRRVLVTRTVAVRNARTR